MKRLKQLSSGILYRNPHPGLKAECAYLPNVVALSAQELLCFYRLGSAFYAADGRIALLRSWDGGRSWRPEGLVWDATEDDRLYSYTAPHATRLRNGILLLTVTRWECDDPTLPVFNAETGGLRDRQTILFRSEDNGRHWSAPVVLDVPSAGGVIDTPSQIIELNNGRLFLACEVWKQWADSSSLHIRSFGLFSDDGGASWGERVDFPYAAEGEKMYSHGRYTQLQDGRIGVLLWTQGIGGQENFDLHLAFSDKNGTEWSTPRPTGIQGQTSWLADMGEGVLAAVYSRREGMRPGIFVTLSHDGGQTWQTENPFQVWDAVGQEYLGVTHRPDYPASHDNIAFGKPNVVRLAEGKLLASWWCTQQCVTHTRFALLDTMSN